LGHLTPFLRGVVFVGEAAARVGLNLERIRLA